MFYGQIIEINPILHLGCGYLKNQTFTIHLIFHKIAFDSPQALTLITTLNILKRFGTL
jgi:hypothetical protein